MVRQLKSFRVGTFSSVADSEGQAVVLVGFMVCGIDLVICYINGLIC